MEGRDQTDPLTRAPDGFDTGPRAAQPPEPCLSGAGGWQHCVSDGLHVPGVGPAAATEDGDRRVLRPQPQVIGGQLHPIAASPPASEAIPLAKPP
jgi:hypothetical protein